MRRAALLFLVLQFASRPQDLPVFRADAQLVTVPCIVTDRSGIPAPDLRAEDFRLYDNGAPQQIRNVWRQSDLPMVLGIIVDISESQRSLVREHQAAVRPFLERLLRPRDRAFVVEVNEKATLRSEVTGAATGLAEVLLHRGGEPLGEPCPTLRNRSLCGGTALWNAVYAAAHLKLRAFDGSKALLILSDGNDTGSVPHGLDDAAQEVQRAGASVYAIQYPDPLAQRSSNGLARLTAGTGGALFDPPGIDYTEILSTIGASLRAQYVLGYRPSHAGAGRHELRLEVTRPGLTVRGRKEYIE